jgi:shikimate kinase
MSCSLFLVGLPGCGKTTLGRAAAEAAGRSFLDVDEEITRAHGPIPGIFAQFGEARFRELETEVLAWACAVPSAIVSCGGGIVLRPENLKLMRAAGRIVFLDRPLECILSDVDFASRPLLAGGEAALRALAEVRLPLYRACADVTVANLGTPEETRNEINRLLEDQP